MSIVSTNIFYNSDILSQNLNLLLRAYPFLNVKTVGNSVLKKPIYAIKLGRGSKKYFILVQFMRINGLLLLF